MWHRLVIITLFKGILFRIGEDKVSVELVQERFNVACCSL